MSGNPSQLSSGVTGTNQGNITTFENDVEMTPVTRTVTQQQSHTHGAFYMPATPITQQPLGNVRKAGNIVPSAFTGPAPSTQSSAAANTASGASSFTPPKTVAGQYLSHSEGFMQRAGHVGTHHMQSLPSFGARKQRITVHYDDGVDVDYHVNTSTMQHVTALLGTPHATSKAVPVMTTTSSVYSASIPTFRFGIYQQPSLGSLPSAASAHSSRSSLASTSTQSSGIQSVGQRTDAVTNFKQHFQMLVNSGRIQEAAQLHHEMDMMLFSGSKPSQVKPNPTMEVSQFDNDHVDMDRG